MMPPIDQRCSVCAADKSGIAETFRANDATIARLRAENAALLEGSTTRYAMGLAERCDTLRTALNAAAVALDVVASAIRDGFQRNSDYDERERAYLARDAARRAAQEGI